VQKRMAIAWIGVGCLLCAGTLGIGLKSVKWRPLRSVHPHTWVHPTLQELPLALRQGFSQGTGSKGSPGWWEMIGLAIAEEHPIPARDRGVLTIQGAVVSYTIPVPYIALARLYGFPVKSNMVTFQWILGGLEAPPHAPTLFSDNTAARLLLLMNSKQDPIDHALDPIIKRIPSKIETQMFSTYPPADQALAKKYHLLNLGSRYRAHAPSGYYY